MIARETIEATLFSKLENAAEFKSSGRRFKHWDDVMAADQPALFLQALHEEAKIVTKLPTIFVMTYDCWIYAKTGGDETVPPSQIVNPLIDAVVGVMLPVGGQDEQTLGNLVHRCRIEGKIEKFLGELGDQAVVIIPITVMMPQG